MIKKNFFKTFISLILIGGLAKIISIVAKIVISRSIPTMAMSIYSLTIPTLSLLLNIAQFGIPTTISKLIAKRKYPIFKIMQVSILIILLIDLFFGTIYIFLVPLIANNYLKNSLTYPTLYGMVLLIPLVSLTSLLKGYFIGIGDVKKNNSCQISEELARLLFVILFINFLNKNNFALLAFFAMFSSIVGEIASLIHLVLSLNIKNKKIKKRIKIENNSNFLISKIIMKYSLMNTSTKLIGSLIYFLEPIIFTSLMLKNNVSQETLTLEYGIVNSYVFSLILLPCFFSNCFSIYMLPKLSKYVEKNNYLKAKKTFLSITFLSLIIGLVCLFIIYLFPTFFLKTLYGNTLGITYLKKYSLFFFIVFIQMPIHVAMVCFDKEKFLLIEALVCNIIRIVGFIIFIPMFHTEGMIIAILLSSYISIFMHIFTLFRCFLSLKNKSQRIINIKT